MFQPRQPGIVIDLAVERKRPSPERPAVSMGNPQASSDRRGAPMGGVLDVYSQAFFGISESFRGLTEVMMHLGVSPRRGMLIKAFRFQMLARMAS
jgi:hypothetical protein